VQNLVMFIAVVVVTVNLIVDLAYMFVDPRIRLRT
jgi:ABC-type dipeptide/oligopeptide/nickel transport system permease component